MSDLAGGRLILITGATASGKTTVGREVAALLPRAMHVDGDAIQRFVVSGAVPMDLPPPPGAVDQLMLRYASAITVAGLYRRSGFDAVVSDNVFESHLPGLLFLAFADAPTEPVHVVVLDPPVDVIKARYDRRPGGGYADGITPEALTAAISRTPRIGLWLDTVGQTPSETAADLLGRLDAAEISHADLLSRLNGRV